ncbi:hypothetical protein [Psychrobium sp. 1_MG-2023]|uniref:hypothetical protein n=1 Tax=Psychrobium sp. 1_MG-2023 TaxID=3062624 RepID=UPI000C32CB75|nr:hypothetical protein [Psychrobium sp. 1_MG-2023]MDP2559740.1 hypothetical protein [Psychrobium sp. 1_MG-2023]PKF59151.1 hypothetical protein CW748_02890 [Alteromonadales bacterium alter-6D02]
MANITDRAILKLIYTMYYPSFIAFEQDNTARQNKNYVAIDCQKLAEKLSVDPEIIFGRLYYHLDKKYGYIQPDGARVSLFLIRLGGDRHVIHFPLLSAALAEEEQSFVRFTIPIVLSIAALCLSILALVLR